VKLGLNDIPGLTKLEFQLVLDCAWFSVLYLCNNLTLDRAVFSNCFCLINHLSLTTSSVKPYCLHSLKPVCVY